MPPRPGALTPNTFGAESTPLASEAQSDWSIVSSANETYTGNVLNGVACVSASDCWAVGSYGLVDQTLIEHWDGTSWAIVASPNTGEGWYNILTDVTCVSASDCWAVGSIFLHWDGTSWTSISAPSNATSVSCASSSDCWAVGYYYNGSAWQALIEGWDGTAWAIVTSPNTSATEDNYLSDVTCVSASDCLAVGYYLTFSHYQTLIEYWDGTAWSVVPSAPKPIDMEEGALNGVTCASTSDCWAVGYYRNRDDFDQHTLIERWDGTAWSIVPSPNTSADESNVLVNVTCASAWDCWAVGYYSQQHSPFYVLQTLVEHWDGTSWARVLSPNSGSAQPNQLWAVICTSAPDCWAVGYSSTTAVQTLIERWNGTAWVFASSPNVTTAPQPNILSDVACVSAADCWAVGYYYTVYFDQHTLIERWDGTSWAIVTSPDAGPLSGVTCVSASDCWAVGYDVGQSLIEHWDGTSWAIVTSPTDLGQTDENLLGVTCTSASDCWAVGYYFSSIIGSEQTLIEHWNGIAWAIVPSPNSGTTQLNQLSAVICTSASGCWAVGYYKNGTTHQTLIERWNGVLWTVVTSPNTSTTNHNELYDVTCASASDCWAVGYDVSTEFVSQTVIERWNGTSWAIVSSPNPSATENFLDGVTCASASQCWAVGKYDGGSGAYQTLVERWSGTVWTIVTSPNSSTTQDNDLLGVTCASGSDCWAVGYYVHASGFEQTLIEHYTPGPPIPTSVVSRKTHGTAGDFDVELPLVGNPGIECRSGETNNDYQVVVTFANPVTFNTVGITFGTGTISSASGSGTPVITVNLTGVTNAQTITLTVSGVNDGTISGDVGIRMGVLLGDVNSTGRTDSGDVTQVRNHTVSIPDQQTFRFDVNTSGRIDAGDVTVTRNASVTVLP
jgi:hypothetical protein